VKLLLDEHLSRSIARILRDAGYDVLSVVEDHRGTTDVDLLALAREEGRVLITRDRDFSRHIFLEGVAPPRGLST
jgi:predicted nuclease of predicted toxin-antitoxin system